MKIDLFFFELVFRKKGRFCVGIKIFHNLVILRVIKFLTVIMPDIIKIQIIYSQIIIKKVRDILKEMGK